MLSLATCKNGPKGKQSKWDEEEIEQDHGNVKEALRIGNTLRKYGDAHWNGGKYVISN
jgi:hypothetical protein